MSSCAQQYVSYYCILWAIVIYVTNVVLTDMYRIEKPTLLFCLCVRLFPVPKNGALKSYKTSYKT